MSYKALYRTYRPSTFGEVAGQKAIVRTLQNALSQNKIAHAYLFSGPRGTGKTSMAKLFAKALNCEEGFGHQCNKCQNCLGVIDGSHPDVYEIDAASNNGVNEVRMLIENINYSPIRGKYKIYIIDEVHMMTQAAFNALLKTLEEPPHNVIFILATTEPHKVIPTILSRCQRYNFSKVSDKDITDRLKTILKAEEITFEDDALDLLVSLADGGVRDALSMLDQVLAYAEQKLKLDDVLALFALTSKIDQIGLINAVATSDIEKVFTTLSKLIDNGVDIRRLTSDLLNLLKDALIYHKTENKDLLIYLRENEVQVITSKLEIRDLNFIIENLLKAQTEYRFASDIKNIFEVTLLRIMTTLNSPTEQIITQPVVKETPFKPVKAQPAPQPKPVSPPVLQNNEKEDELPPFMEDVPIKSVPFVPSTPEPKSQVNNQIEKPKSVRQSTPIENASFATEGTNITIDESTLVKILTLSDRDEKMNLKNEKWDDLQLLTMDATLSEFAVLLHSGNPYALSREILILEYDFPRNVGFVNLKENQIEFRKIMGQILGREIPVYALTHEQAQALTKKYRNISQVGKLPKVKNVTEELEGIY